MGDKTIEMAALGRPFTLGSLYDQTTGTILAQKPWKKVNLEDESKIQITQMPGTKFEVALSNTIKERANNLKVSAELSLELASGSIKISGSADYASESKSDSNRSSVSFLSKRTTETKSLTQAQLITEGLDYPEVLDNKEATHFVSSITYGQNAVMVFETEKQNEEELKNIVGKLSINIKEIVKGSGELQLTDREKTFKENLKCKFHGDYSDISPPLNFDQARSLIPTLTEAGHGEPIPISVTLTPVNQLGNAAMKIVREMSSSAVIHAGKMLQDLEDIQVELATLRRSKTAAEFAKFRDIISKMAILYNNQGISFKKELSELLPQIKGTGKEEQDLFDIIIKYQASVYRKPLLVEWAQKMKKETETVDDILEVCHATQIKVASSGAEFRNATLSGSKGLLYLEAKLKSRLDPEVLNVLNSNQDDVVALPTQDGEAVKVFWRGEDKFIHHFSKYKNHVRKMKKDEAEYETIFYLDYMNSSNTATVAFLENGISRFSGIKLEDQNNSKISHLKHIKETNTIKGELTEVVPGNERVKIQIKIKPKNKPDDDEEDETDEGEPKDDYKIRRLFDAEGSKFELNLTTLSSQLREGLDYLARVRWYLRSGLAGDWEDDLPFKAWASPQIQITTRTKVLEVGVPAKIECQILAGYPEPTVKWTKSGVIVPSDHKSDLVFESPTKETKGTYTVEVSNGFGEAQKHSVLVTVAETTEGIEQIIRRKIDEDVEPRFLGMDKKILDVEKGVDGNDRRVQGDIQRIDMKLREAGARKAAFSVTDLYDRGNILKFRNEKVDNDSAYNPATGVYRVPYDGTYFFTWSLLVGLKSNTTGIAVTVVLLYVDGSGTDAYSGTSTGSDCDSLTGSLVLQLTRGQEVTLRKMRGELDSNGACHTFSGFLVT